MCACMFIHYSMSKIPTNKNEYLIHRYFFIINSLLFYGPLWKLIKIKLKLQYGLEQLSNHKEKKK